MNVGGVVGFTTGSVINCSNAASVTGTQCYVGGVVGENDSTSSKISGCSNTGPVEGGQDSMGRSGVGGVVGVSKAAISASYNKGEVNGKREVGGVVGRSTSEVTGCYNEGKVSDEDYYTGGVVGNAVSGKVNGCYNTGDVSGKWVGGVVGNSGADVQNCYNTGTIESEGSAGGVVGSNASSKTVSYCYSTGAILGADRSSGGIVGSNSGTVAYCYYAGSSQSVGNYSGTISYTVPFASLALSNGVTSISAGQTVHITTTNNTVAAMKMHESCGCHL